ncbi:MAG TPA: hypothetical protein VHL57_03170 [Flavobacteriales bacterium]|jgi:hypothetical protein|nr:hypothetical protein [Flavobacteriales bacterium]
MMRIVAFIGVLQTSLTPAQVPWVRETELRCAYYREEPDHHGRPQADVYLFYANDSVVRFTFGEWEGAVAFDANKPLNSLDDFIQEFHCYMDMPGGEFYDVAWFTGGALVWYDRYYEQVRFQDNASVMLLDLRRFIRLKCWDRIVPPPKWNSRRLDPCNDG